MQTSIEPKTTKNRYSTIMKAILVTGSSGFLGTKVVEHALKQGYKVFGVDIRPPLDSSKENFEFTQVDVNKMDIKMNQRIEFIVHTASSLPYGNSAKEFEDNNIAAATVISRIAKENNTFLVEIGSSSVYGKPEQLPVNQHTRLNPLDNYAKSKLKAEIVIRENLATDEYCIIRPRTILGTGRSGIFSIFFSLIAGNLPLPLPNSGRQVIQFVHVDDLAALSIHLGQKRIPGIWPAASPEPKPLKEYLQVISNNDAVSVRYIPINPLLFKIIGEIAFRMGVTKFTPWHFGAFPYDNYVDSDWVPTGFEYNYSSTEAFVDTYHSNNTSKNKLPKMIKIGKRI